MKRSIFKRLFALTMSLLMVCSLLPITALAEETPLTLEQALDAAEELTLPYSQEVTASSTYIDENDSVRYFQAYHYKNTGTEAVWVYYSAYRDTDMTLRLYKTGTETKYEQVNYFDNDSMDNLGEDGVFTVEAGGEYWILITPHSAETPFTIDVTFDTVEDSSDQLATDATAIPSLPYTTDIQENTSYFVGGELIDGSVFSLDMTEGQTVFLRTSGTDIYDCTTMVFAASESDGATYLTKLDSGYAAYVSTGTVFQAPADGIYYFVACNSYALEMVAFTGQYHPTTGEDEVPSSAVTALPYTVDKQIGGAAGDYWEQESDGLYYGMSSFQYTATLAEGQAILPSVLWSDASDSNCSVVIGIGEESLEMPSGMAFTAPENGDYTVKFLFYDYPWEKANVTLSLKDVSGLPTEIDLIDDATPLTLGETSTKEGVEALVGGYIGMPGRYYGFGAAFSVEVEAGTAYQFKGNPDSENYIFEETEEYGYLTYYGFDSSTVYTFEEATTLYVVSTIPEAGDLSMTVEEWIDNSLSFTDPEDLPVPGEDDLWSWDNDTLTLTLKDGCNLTASYEALYLPDGTTIIVEGEVSIENLEYDCIYADGDLAVRGNAVDEDSNPTATLNILTGDDGIDGYNITIEDLNLNIEADSDGIYAEESLTIDNCVVDIISGDEGIDCDNIEDDEGNPAGECTITDSTVTIWSPWDESIDADILTLTNCQTTLTAGNGDEADGSYEAIDVEVSVTVDGGSLEAVSYIDNAISVPVLTVTDGTKLKLATYADDYEVINCDEYTLPEGSIMTGNAVTTNKYGDLNGGDEITAEDALLALQIATSKVNATPVQAAVGDVDASDGVAAVDALLILQYATQKIDQFPVEATVEAPDDSDTGDTGIGSGDAVEDNIG